jgi:hypothetical protein
MQVLGRLVPWIILVLALPVALWALAVTGPTACGEMEGAFRHGVTTKSSTTLELLADHCTITRNSDGAVTRSTIVNWSGILAALAILVGAWFLGALIGRQISWQRGLAGIGLATAAMFVAMATFFI